MIEAKARTQRRKATIIGRKLKIIEEANEYIDAVSNSDRDHIIHEAADLWFHTLVSLTLNGISSDDILKELENRFGLSGLEEKRLRKK